jgi:cytochrome c biogenesis protein CcdA
MEGMLVGSASALWLGILTSISPCPLATNIAAMSYIGRRVDNARLVFWTGMLYTLGRTLTYLLIGAILVSSVLSAPLLSHFLQKYMNKLLGPILILVGMVLLDLIVLNLPDSGVSEKTQKRVERLGIWGGALLGIVFALSFCPVSAALFFGSLVPLAVKYDSGILLPCIYGVGTALPVTLFAVLIAIGIGSVGKAYDKIVQFEWWARRATGAIFIVVGIYLSLVHIFGVLS